MTFTGEMDSRAIFVVSDGMDTASDASARDVMQKAAEANVAIYAVGLTSRYIERGKSVVRAPNPALREIADDTGGQERVRREREGLLSAIRGDD